MALRESLQTAFDAAPPDPRDRPLADLALAYAADIDDGEDLTKLGPALLAALEALHMSPRARAAGKKAVTDEQPTANPLDQLSSRRLRRGLPEDLDAAAS